MPIPYTSDANTAVLALRQRCVSLITVTTVSATVIRHNATRRTRVAIPERSRSRLPFSVKETTQTMSACGGTCAVVPRGVRPRVGSGPGSGMGWASPSTR